MTQSLRSVHLTLDQVRVVGIMDTTEYSLDSNDLLV